MKRMIYILAVVMAVGCHRSMAPWPGDGDKQDVAMYVRTRSLSGITASPSVYQFFVYDQVHSSMSRYMCREKASGEGHCCPLFRD